MYQRLTETQNHEKELRMEYSEDTKNRLTKAIKYFIKHGLFVFLVGGEASVSTKMSQNLNIKAFINNYCSAHTY